MSAMIAFSWIGIMLLIGMVCRAKIPFLANMLMPASVTGGILGFILLNIPGVTTALGIDPNMYNIIVNILFTLSFISMGLTSTPKAEGQTSADVAKQMTKGSLGMGVLWAMTYCIQPLIGFGVILIIGGMFAMPAEYGTLFPFAFCQGPGQSATFGGIIDATTQFTSASQVAITYSVIGFLFAFLVGVPLAKIGLKKGLAAHPEKLSPAVLKGLYKPAEQKEFAGKITTYNGNIDVLAFHLALVTFTFVVTIYVQKLLMLVPFSMFQTMASMTFIVGYMIACLLKVLMSKIGIKQYHNDVLQARITGTTTDFLIVGAFMAVQLSVVGKWLVPILVASVIVGAVTLAISLYFGPRLGGDCDFERTLGLWGCLTGTCPSGVAVIRVVDPNLKTTASAEMGMMNLFMIPCYLIAPLIIEFCAGHVTFTTLALTCLATAVGCLIVIKIFRCWGKPTYSFKHGVVCPDVTEDCKEFEKSGTHSPF